MHEHDCVFCSGMSPKQFYQDIQAKIKTYGTAVIGVGPGPHEPPFAYTIGLSEVKGFEVIMFGVNPQHATLILNNVREFLKENDIQAGVPYDKFANLPCQFQRCLPEKAYLNAHQAFTYYNLKRLGSRLPKTIEEWDAAAHDDIQVILPVFQLVIPDRQGRFPEDPEFDHAHMDPLQPLLYK